MLNINSKVDFLTSLYFCNEYSGIVSTSVMDIRHKKLERYFEKLPTDIKEIYNKKIYYNLNYNIPTLVELCLMKFNRNNYYFLKQFDLNKNYFKYCHVCNNLLLNITGDFTHDKNGNMIFKTPHDQTLEICGLLKYKRYVGNKEKIKKNKFGIEITDNGKNLYIYQEKINNIIYKPILTL